MKSFFQHLLTGEKIQASYKVVGSLYKYEKPCLLCCNCFFCCRNHGAATLWTGYLHFGEFPQAKNKKDEPDDEQSPIC